MRYYNCNNFIMGGVIMGKMKQNVLRLISKVALANARKEIYNYESGK